MVHVRCSTLQLYMDYKDADFKGEQSGEPLDNLLTLPIELLVRF